MERKALKRFIFLLLALIMVGCSNTVKYPVSEVKGAEGTANLNHVSPNIKVHAWDYLYRYGDESEGYLTYSYVLSNKSLDLLSFEHPDAYEKIQILLESIKGSTIYIGNA